MHEILCSKIGAKSNLLSSVKTTVSFRSPTSVLSGIFFFFIIHVGEQYGAAFFFVMVLFIGIPLFGNVFVSFFFLFQRPESLTKSAFPILQFPWFICLSKTKHG